MLCFAWDNDDFFGQTFGLGKLQVSRTVCSSVRICLSSVALMAVVQKSMCVMHRVLHPWGLEF